MKKKENFLDYIPYRNPRFGWEKAGGLVTVNMEHRGFFDRIAQRFFHRPKVSRIELDMFGSFVWMQIDGSRTVGEIGELIEEKFADEAKPIYPRLIRYLQILKDNKFIDYIRP